MVLGWSITSIVLTAIMYSKLKDVEGNFDSILANWKSDVITDFEVKEGSANSNTALTCSADYEPFLSYTFPGTNRFCLCTSGNIIEGNCCGSSSFRRMLRRSSSSSSSRNKCNTCYGKQYDSVSAETYQKFRITVGSDKFPVLFCVKRLSGYNFFDKAK